MQCSPDALDPNVLTGPGAILLALGRPIAHVPEDTAWPFGVHGGVPVLPAKCTNVPALARCSFCH